MQFNMGEGKLLVIVPAVAAILTSLRESLVRVIVGKPQSKQMFQMFIARLGGLQDVVVHRFPFLRDFRLGIDDVCLSLVHEMPRAIEYSDQHGPNLFPFIRILGGSETQYRLICQTGFAGLPIARQAKVLQEAIYIYLIEPKLLAEQIAQVKDPERCSLWTDTIKNSLFLLRGFLAGGILGFVLGQKRWRVNYGLDLERRPPTRLVVPYRAKDSPSPRSEFSHPKVVILLILFSYYYGGLGD
ncbi:hypothetical protein PoMZ_08988 [Pyricularia oryzae]|uniref:ubiquitinyl hydrolase 1 n=1 Tax=Pyricularia oryzae TaxID=318829 RepID=A0A4P7MVQ0_PYROR|nr:hypothetical protein PoMZ_08988 [Pyricularia oryzae]